MARLFLFKSKQISRCYSQYFAKHQKLIICDKARANLNTADAISFDDHALDLQACRKIFLREPHTPSCLFHTCTTDIFVTVKVIDFHTSPIFCANVKNLLDFNIFLRYNCVKDKNFAFCHTNKEKNMEHPGVIKEFDTLGRIVIPKELRKRFALEEQVEIVATVDGILLRSPKYYLVKREDKN